MKKSIYYRNDGSGRFTTEREIWASILARCRTKSHTSYPRYGGRGIKVCKRWQISFRNFYDDMGPRPSKKYTIERKNNNGMYSKRNCHWATYIEQNNNRRDNVVVTFKGRKQTATQWARELGLSARLVRGRLQKGWSPTKAFFTKINGIQGKRNDLRGIP